MFSALSVARKSLQPGFRLTILASSLMLAHQGSAMAEDAGYSDTLIVSASGTEHTRMTAPAFTTVIDAQALSDNPSQSVADLIGRSAGVSNTQDSTGRDEIRVRGMSGSYTLVLVDGRRVSSSNALWRGGDFDFSSIPRSSIERIEIVRGPMSSLYGADAMGGVINIITKKGGGEWQTTLDASYEMVTSGEEGSELRTNLSTAGAVTDDVYLRFSAEAYNRDAWFEDKADTVPTQEEKEARNISAGVSWDLDEQQTLDFDLGINRDDRPYAEYSANSFRDQSIERNTFAVAHTGRWDWGSSYLSLNRESGEIDDYNSRYTDPKQRHLEEENFKLEGSANLQVGRNQITLGAEYQNQLVTDKDSFSKTGESEADQTAVFVEDQISLTRQLTLTLGGRYDHHDVYGGEFTPRGFVVYQLNDGLSLKGGVSKAYKAPAPYQRVEEYQIVSCGGGCFITGNDDIKPETSLNYELGVEVQQKRFHLSAVAFRSEVEDMINRSANGSDYIWENQDEVTVEGIELEGSTRLTDSLSLDASFTYLNTEDGDGNPLTYRPEQKLDAGVNWKATDKINSRLGVSYLGEQYSDATTKQGAYTLLDLSVNAQVSEGLTVRGGVNNLTDVSLDDDDDDYYSNIVARSIYIGASYNF